MAWYCFWSPRKEADWQLALASERQAIELGGQAEFTTALDIDNDYTDPNLDHHQVAYTGPFYLDFDSADIEESIEQVKKFLQHLQTTYAVDLKQLHIFASGGKGFHVIVPQRMFLSRIAPSGYQGLPAIYKEMAFAMYHDTMDLSVYTAKRGRMWRCPNFKRTNGKYKVALTPEEALSMTVEYYEAVTSVPRPLIQPAPADHNPKLELLWAQSRDKVSRALKKNASKKRDAGLLARMDGQVPPTLEALMNGEGIKEGAGFQQIATQLAIVAHGLGMARDAFLQACEGLCDKHRGDGTRYGSFRLRQKELGRMYDYMAGNPTYDFSGAAIRALVEGPATDLIAGEATDLAPDGKSDMAITLGMSMSREGIFRLNDEGYRVRVSAVGLESFRYLQHIQTGESIGYQVETFLDGVPRGNRRLTMDYFTSKQRFQGFTLALGASCQLNDAQVSALADVARKLALNEENTVVYAVTHEGLDIVPVPGEPGEFDILWMSENKVLSKRGIPYAFVNGVYGGDDMPYKTDLLDAPRLPLIGREQKADIEYLGEQELEELKEDLHHLLNMNVPQNMAKVVGWAVATFLCPVLRRRYKQFPILHVYGPAESGKTTTMNVLARLQYYVNPHRLMSAAGATTAPFTMAATGTSSIMMLIDEYKPVNMSAKDVERLRYFWHVSYNNAEVARGRLARESGETRVVTQHQDQTAPVVFIAETMETQKAQIDRAVIVPFTQQGKRLHEQHGAALKERPPSHLGSLGRHIVESLVYSDKLSPEVICASVAEYEKLIRANPLLCSQDRPVFNLAVVATGLRVLKACLFPVFGDEFSKELDTLLASILSPNDEQAAGLAPHMKPELIQVLEWMAVMSNREDGPEEERLYLGKEYGYTPDYLEINARKAFMKYQYCMRKYGERSLYQSAEAFSSALSQHPGVTRVRDSLLGTVGVFRIANDHLYGQGLVEESFKM